MQDKKLATEEGLSIHQLGGRALRDKRPANYFSSLVNKRWEKWRKAHKPRAKKKKNKK